MSYDKNLCSLLKKNRSYDIIRKPIMSYIESLYSSLQVCELVHVLFRYPQETEQSSKPRKSWLYIITQL